MTQHEVDAWLAVNPTTSVLALSWARSIWGATLGQPPVGDVVGGQAAAEHEGGEVLPGPA
ncbi:hypothetical protein ACFWFI_05530 [Streptomyces sp. NPDC060209]|uniref:hypothetical protein n=1 Tax=Streptomyces sp. NPDC060209 TaxID=3347073 RepID=UPI00366177A2